MFLYQGTALAGPYPTPAMRALAPEGVSSLPSGRISARLLVTLSLGSRETHSLGGGMLGVLRHRAARGVWVPFGSTPWPDLGRPRPRVNGVGCTGNWLHGHVHCGCSSEAAGPWGDHAGWASHSSAPPSGCPSDGGSAGCAELGFSPMAKRATLAARRTAADQAWVTERERPLGGADLQPAD